MEKGVRANALAPKFMPNIIEFAFEEVGSSL
jgi:hypothetical protein